MLLKFLVIRYSPTSRRPNFFVSSYRCWRNDRGFYAIGEGLWNVSAEATLLGRGGESATGGDTGLWMSTLNSFIGTPRES